MFLVCHTKHIVIVARTEYPVLNVTDFGYATHVWTLSLDKVVNKGDLRQMNTCDCIWILKHPQILTMSSHPNLWVAGFDPENLNCAPNKAVVNSSRAVDSGFSSHDEGCVDVILVAINTQVSHRAVRSFLRIPPPALVFWPMWYQVRMTLMDCIDWQEF